MSIYWVYDLGCATKWNTRLYKHGVYCRAQKELVEKERREDDEARKKRHYHADEVRDQIREKEQLRISERNAFFEEGVKLDHEARQRRVKLEDVKKKKLETLRYLCYSFLVLNRVVSVSVE